MRFTILLLISLPLFLSACANPLNQATANRYLDQCSEAERRGDLELAEQSCYRALVNVEWGNLGKEQQSQNLYNLARIKKQNGKLNEAEELLKLAIEIERELFSEMTPKLGRRYVVLASVYFIKTKMATGEFKPEGVDLSQGEDMIHEGALLLKEVAPISDQFSGGERQSVKEVYQGYAEELIKINQKDMAKEFSNLSAKL